VGRSSFDPRLPFSAPIAPKAIMPRTESGFLLDYGWNTDPRFWSSMDWGLNDPHALAGYERRINTLNSAASLRTE
jgi:hypothetical protein